MGSRSIKVEAKLRDGASVTTSPAKSVSTPNFSKGGAPQYLWVPRVQDDGCRRPPNVKASHEESLSAAESYRKVPQGGTSIEDTFSHNGAPPEIEFQVRPHPHAGVS